MCAYDLLRNHASNVYMLHALGITHVVSVGECALVPPVGVTEATTGAPEYQVVLGGTGSVASSSSSPSHRGSLWREEKEGRIKVLDIKVRSYNVPYFRRLI